RRFGFRVEPGYARETNATHAVDATWGVALTLSWKLLHDFSRDLHLQLEAGGRAPWDVNRHVTPGESDHPGYFDLRGAIRVGRFTTRGSVGSDTDGATAHLRGSIAVLTGFDRQERFGFWGLEVEADSGNSSALVLAPNVVADCTPLSLPLRI